MQGITEEKARNGNKFTIKQLEKTKKSLLVRLEKLNDQSKKDQVINFEELGIDRLFVDDYRIYITGSNSGTESFSVFGFKIFLGCYQ